MESQAVDEMLERLQAEVHQHNSILAQSEHRNIFQLMDRHNNRSFKITIKRLRDGSRVPFLDFLRAACPCASEERIRLYNYWRVHVFWNQESQFTELVKKWRKDFESTKDSSELASTTPRGLFSFQSKQDADPNERVLTLEDLVNGDVILQSVAAEMMQKHENLSVDTELGVHEFMQVFCQGQGSTFEQKKRAEFERLAAGHRKLRRTSISRTGSKRTLSKRSGISKRSSVSAEEELEGNESGFPLYELLGDADVSFAFNLLSACEDDFDNAPMDSLQEF